MEGDWAVERVAGSATAFALREHDGNLLISDLRMGEAPHFTFTFNLGARRRDPHPARLPSERPSLTEMWRTLRQRL